jgi:hypothetical protein
MAVIGTAVAYIATYFGAAAGTAGAIGAVVNAVVALASLAYSVSSYQSQQKAAKRAQWESIQRNGYRNFRQPLVARRIVYGRVRVGGPVVFAHNRAGFEAHLVIALASHELQEIESVWLLRNEMVFQRNHYYPPPSGQDQFGRVAGRYGISVIIWVFMGTSGQDIGQQMRTAKDPRDTPYIGSDISLNIITAADKFRGIAAIYAVTKGFSGVFEGQSPEFSAIVKGKKLYDPRTGTTIYSANVALAAGDYLINVMEYAMEALDLDAWKLAADICDEAVPLAAGGFERRYEANGVVTADMEHRMVLEALGQAMAGRIRYASGQWIIEAGKAKESTVTFTEEDVLSDYEVHFERPDRACPNAVRGTFYDRESWQPASFPAYEDATAVAAEGGISWLELELPFTTSPSMAQRISRIELGRARAARSLTLPMDLRGWMAQAGDVVTYSAAELGINEELYEVTAVTLSPQNGPKGAFLGTRLDLVSYDPSIFAWNEATDEKPMVRGQVELDSVRSRYLHDPTYLELVTQTVPSFAASYTFSWGNPETAAVALDRVEIALDVSITVMAEDTTTSVQVVSQTVNVTDGAEVRLIGVTKNYGAGLTYVSHLVTKATVIAYFANNTKSPVVNAVPT